MSLMYRYKLLFLRFIVDESLDFVGGCFFKLFIADNNTGNLLINGQLFAGVLDAFENFCGCLVFAEENFCNE